MSATLPSTAPPPSDLVRSLLQLLAVGALIGASAWILRPFLVASVWAGTIVVTSWPILLGLESRLGGRRGLATAVMTLALLLLLVVPLYIAITTLTKNVKHIGEWSQSLAAVAVPPPPSWVRTLPLVGAPLETRWHRLATASPQEIAARLRPFARTAAVWFAGQVGNIGLLLLQFVLTVVTAAILYVNGETAAAGAQRFARRLAGAHADNALHLAVQATRAVALGVVVTALVQSGLAGVGLVVAGVPFAALLTALMFILGVAQIGAGPVLIGAVIWVYSRDGAVWGTAFLVWAILCGLLDNILRPILIRRGADLPLLLIFSGVVGGLVAFGVIGLFIGPVVLAVAYTLLAEWVAEPNDAPPASAGS